MQTNEKKMEDKETIKWGENKHNEKRTKKEKATSDARRSRNRREVSKSRGNEQHMPSGIRKVSMVSSEIHLRHPCERMLLVG